MAVELDAFDCSRRYLDAILKPSPAEALECARDMINSPEDVFFCWEKVITPAMHQVGDLWAEGKITVGQEHLATSITQRVMSVFYPIILDARLTKGRIVCVSSPGELHDVGVRMIADLLEIKGWNVFFAGGNIPAEDVLDLLKRESARFLCVSTTLPSNLQNTRDLIASIREDNTLRQVHVLVGGAAYSDQSHIWAATGADSIAHTAEAASVFLDSAGDLGGG